MVPDNDGLKPEVRTRLNVSPANADNPAEQKTFKRFLRTLGDLWGTLFEKGVEVLNLVRRSSSAKRYAQANQTNADAEYRRANADYRHAEARVLEQKQQAKVEEATRIADDEREQRAFERELLKAEDARKAGVEALKMIQAVMDTPGSVMSKDLQLEQLKHTYPELAAKIEEVQGYLHDLRVTHGGDMRLIFPDQPKAIEASATEAED